MSWAWSRKETLYIDFRNKCDGNGPLAGMTGRRNVTNPFLLW